VLRPATIALDSSSDEGDLSVKNRFANAAVGQLGPKPERPCSSSKAGNCESRFRDFASSREIAALGILEFESSHAEKSLPSIAAGFRRNTFDFSMVWYSTTIWGSNGKDALPAGGSFRDVRILDLGHWARSSSHRCQRITLL
jgi:hypothetical protein